VLDERTERILKDFEASIDARTKDLGKRNTVPDTAPVFHYTNAAGLKGILEKDAIWLTDRIHLNDPSELAYGMKFALDWCAEKAKGGDRLTQLFFETLGTGLPTVLEQHGFYVSSFSLDGDLLSQWCRYADDGRGFCLEFYPGFLNSGWKTTGGLVTFSISYDEEDIKRRQEKCLADALQYLRNAEVFRTVSQAASSRQFVVGMQQRITSELLWNAIQFKHTAYRDELEARVLITGDLAELQSSSLHRTRPRGSELVSYFELPFTPSIRGPDVLKGVRIGPAASVESVKSARALLRSAGLSHVEVTQSKIPYRSR
jgi:Protein of unknown function (DUF2971)